MTWGGLRDFDVSGGLLYGRTRGALDRTQDAGDSLFAAIRADKWEFGHRIYKHCTFANVSFLAATLDNCTFLNCAFLDCYFRKTVVTMRFVDATFQLPVFEAASSRTTSSLHSCPTTLGCDSRWPTSSHGKQPNDETLPVRQSLSHQCEKDAHAC